MNKLCKICAVLSSHYPTVPDRTHSRYRVPLSKPMTAFSDSWSYIDYVCLGFKEQLWKGSHSFSFQYTLPAQLPSSFIGRFGFVRYYCESTLERWRNKETKRIYFSVSSITDINQVPKADVSMTLLHSQRIAYIL